QERSFACVFDAISAYNINNVFSWIFSTDKPRPTAKSQPFSLPDRIEPVAFVFPKNLPCSAVDDHPFSSAQVITHKFRKPNLPQKTNPLAIRSLRCGQPEAIRVRPHFLFRQISNWKPTLCHLILRQVRKKIRLIFDSILTSHQDRRPFGGLLRL